MKGDTMTETPRTAAGRALLANLEPRFANLPWDPISYQLTLEEVIAIEAEAAQDAARQRDELREALLEIRDSDFINHGPASTVQQMRWIAREALRATEGKQP